MEVVDPLHINENPRFSPKHMEIFRQKINHKADKELLEDPLDEDEVYGLLDLYGQSEDIPNAPMQIDRLLALLEGKSMRKVAAEAGVDHSNIVRAQSAAAEIIAKELDKLFFPDEVTGRFSKEHVEIFRKDINSTVGRELLEGPLDEDEIYGLIELYGRKNRSSATVGRQAIRLMKLLEGESSYRVARESGVTAPTVQNMRSNAVHIIARNLVEVFRNSPRQINNRYVDQLIQKNFLLEIHSIPLKKHLGIINKPLVNGDIIRDQEACERIRVMMVNADARDHTRRGLHIMNAPTDQQLKMIHRLLGNRRDAIDPISLPTLVAQRTVELRKTGQSMAAAEQEISLTINLYRNMIERAVAQTLEWILEPKYRFGARKA